MSKVGEAKSIMRSKINRMTPGDMPDFDSSLTLALKSLKIVPASLKHMIVISDGDPSPATNGVLSGYKAAKIKISTVAVGTHGAAGHSELKRIATTTGGNYYVVTNPNALPQIFMREARRVAKPLVFEPEGGIIPFVNRPHEILSGISGTLPRISGFVLTERKDSPLVEVPILSPKPTEEDTASILATWTYGLGRTAVLTTDAGHRWAKDWANAPVYDQFFSQLVRWTMRPTNDDGKYSIATNIKDGRVQVIVTALDENDGYVNYLEMGAIAVGPDLKPTNLTMRQVAPGRYVGELTPDQAGSYMLSIIPGSNKPPITTGVTIPFSDEYRVRQANMRLLEQLSERKPTGGASGLLSDPLEADSMKELLGQDSYRTGLPPAKSLQDIWPIAVLIGATLFFADVFVRRVALDLGLPLRMLAAKLRGRGESASDAGRRERLDRLRSSKSNVGEDLDRQKANLQFEEQIDNVAATTTNAADAFGVQDKSKLDPSDFQTKAPTLQADEEQSYTSRLLDAKRKAKKNQ
jgi:hypothetical protein